MQKKTLLTAIVLLGVMGCLSGTETCSTVGVCRLPGSSGNESADTVLSPVGEQSIKKIRQAPRLATLAGKTIALVGGSFMASITHPELKRLIMKNYPTAKVLLLNEIGSAGPWPGPGVIRRQKDEFVRKLRQFKVNAVNFGIDIFCFCFKFFFAVFKFLKLVRK